MSSGPMGLKATGGRDAALSLLWRISDEALDPGYLETHARSPEELPRKYGHSVVLALALLILAALLSAAAIQTLRGAPSENRTRENLAARVLVATETIDELEASIAATSSAVTDLRARVLSGSDTDRQLREDLVAHELASGLTTVQGPGVVVELTDGPPTNGVPGGQDLARVLDRDLQVVVNGLFASGAEAVSVNGQRLTALSAIRSAGGAVLVGYRPLSPPYKISAIGDPETLESQFLASDAAEEMRTLAGTYGIGFTTQEEDNVTLPAETDLSLRYAQPRRNP